MSLKNPSHNFINLVKPMSPATILLHVFLRARKPILRSISLSHKCANEILNHLLTLPLRTFWIQCWTVLNPPLLCQNKKFSKNYHFYTAGTSLFCLQGKTWDVWCICWWPLGWVDVCREVFPNFPHYLTRWILITMSKLTCSIHLVSYHYIWLSLSWNAIVVLET